MRADSLKNTESQHSRQTAHAAIQRPQKPHRPSANQAVGVGD